MRRMNTVLLDWRRKRTAHVNVLPLPKIIGCVRKSPQLH